MAELTADPVLDVLHTDVLSIVLDKVGPRELCRLSRVSKRWRTAADSCEAWEKLGKGLGLSEIPDGVKNKTWKHAYAACCRLLVGDLLEVLNPRCVWHPARVLATMGKDLVLVRLESGPQTMWLHQAADQFRMRPLTIHSQKKVDDHTNLTEESFEALLEQTRSKIREGLSTWECQEGGHANWPAPYFEDMFLEQPHTSRVRPNPLQIDVRDHPNWEDHQLRRGKFVSLTVALGSLDNWIPVPLPPPVGNDVKVGYWAARVLRYSSQYDDSTWSAEQATGPPKVFPRYGDVYGAWAPRSSRGQMEHITLQYDVTMKIHHFDVYETFNPGAIIKIRILQETGIYKTVFESTPQQTNIGNRTRVLRIDVPDIVGPARQLEFVFNTINSQSWSEIDGVHIFGKVLEKHPAEDPREVLWFNSREPTPPPIAARETTKPWRKPSYVKSVTSMFSRMTLWPNN